MTALILLIFSFIILYSFDGYRGLGLHPFFYNFALLLLCFALPDFRTVATKFLFDIQHNADGLEVVVVVVGCRGVTDFSATTS